MAIRHVYLDRARDWARGEDVVRALVLTGSQARADGSTDEFSDLDLQVITAEIKRFTDDDGWLDALGDVWIRFPLRKDAPYRLVWFRGGIKADFQFIDPRQVELMPPLSDEYQRGYQVIVDKDGLFRALPPSPHIFPQPPPPSAEDLQTAINEFWFEAIHVAQFIRRREFWVVKQRDWTMKTNLLRLLEWHARELGAETVNTWLLGRRIGTWADAESLAAISRIWAGWRAGELWDALIIQLELFGRLSRELARTLNYHYEAETFGEIERYIRRLRREDKAPPFTE
ncbi:MAG: aminoglycoside 6-adenylyltransferase [Chloroflexota bacterium]|nr:aminoglycoside 6-adenylyltransferase [Chloroflexota bacterium]MDE2945995.1 aminoglycoside 6-adenylyltransferase [Chloroflexota bacterium]